MVVKTLDGTSFAGLIRYMTHDAPERGSKPTTTERVGFCRCDNLPTDDPKMASRIMAATVRDAQYLKAAAGVSARGRKLQKPVKHFIISWPKGAEPSETEQLDAVLGLLTKLDLQDRQRVTVSHRDRGHLHVHVCVNRVSHVDGRAVPLHHEKRECSTWAEKFERERRQRIECPVRVENRQRRERREKEPTIHTTPKRRRRDTGEPVDPLPGETKLWKIHYKAWEHIPADDPSARRTRRELERNLEAVRDDAGPAPGATLERRPMPPLYSRAEIDTETRSRRERAARQSAAIRDQAAAPPPPSRPPEKWLAEIEARLRRERAARQPAAARDQAAAPPPPRRQPAPVEMAPRPAAAGRREEERRRRDEETQAARVQAYAMDGGTEREGADLAKRHPALGGALGAAVWTQLEDQYAATPVQKMRQDIALEILAVAKHASRASSGRHAPPPRPEAVAKDVQDSTDRLIRHAAGKLDLDISLAPDRTQAEPAPTAAPADEQPAPPADTPAAPTATETPAAPTAAKAASREEKRIAAAKAASREAERIAAAEAASREEKRIAATKFVSITGHVMDYAEREGAELANRRPAPTRALCEAARTELEEQHAAAAGDRYTATAEVSGAPLAVGALRRELEREIILAVPEHGSKRHARIPPPRPEAIAEMVHAVQDRADVLIRHAAVEQGLDLPQAEPAPTAAPAEEQPAPPASEAPQHPSLAVREESERQPVRREPAAGRPSPSADEQHPDRGAGQGPGGATSPPVRKDQRRGRE